MDKVSSLELCQVRHPIPSNQSWSLCPRKPPGRTAFSAATASFFLDPPCQFRSVQSHSFHRRPQFRRSAQFRAQNRLNPPAWWIPWWSWWIIYSCVPSKSSTTFLNVPGHFLVTKGLVILNQTSLSKNLALFGLAKKYWNTFKSKHETHETSEAHETQYETSSKILPPLSSPCTPKEKVVLRLRHDLTKHFARKTRRQSLLTSAKSVVPYVSSPFLPIPNHTQSIHEIYRKISSVLIGYVLMSGTLPKPLRTADAGRLTDERQLNWWPLLLKCVEMCWGGSDGITQLLWYSIILYIYIYTIHR